MSFCNTFLVWFIYARQQRRVLITKYRPIISINNSFLCIMYTYLKWGLYQCAALAAIVLKHKARLLFLLLFIRVKKGGFYGLKKYCISTQYFNPNSKIFRYFS